MNIEEKMQDCFHGKSTILSNEKELKIAVPQVEKISQELLENLLEQNFVLIGIEKDFEYEDEDGFEIGTLFTFKKLEWKIEEGKEPFLTFQS